MAPSSKDILDLMEGFVAGSLDAADERQLRERLATDARARRTYLEYMDLHSALSWTLDGSLSRGARLLSPDEGARVKRPSVAASGSRCELATGRQAARLARSGGAIFAACVLLLAAALALVARLERQVSREEMVASDLPAKPIVLRVQTGSATLDLPNVGEIVLEGPTELELLDPMRARLKQGRIRARVTEASGYGFVVEYPDGKVTDLGTEFGISVPPAGTADGRTSLVVFDGAVDLERTKPATEATAPGPIERLTQGEGVCFNTAGDLVRVMSIVTGTVATFQSAGDNDGSNSSRVILDVEDNLRADDTKKFYEIVPGGFREDALCFVDRPKHEWNGVTLEGLPKYLVGADYIKTFCDDKSRTDLEIKVRLGRPANLYVLFRDQLLEPPDWLTRDFRKTDDVVGMDLGKFTQITRGGRWKNAQGAGNSVDQLYGVWVRTVERPGIVTLGANRNESDRSMYGIVAVGLDGGKAAVDGAESKKEKLEAVEDK